MSMSEKELSLVVWSWGILFGAIGSLILICGSIFMLLLQRYREYNNSEHNNFKMIHEKHDDKIHEMSEDLCKLLGGNEVHRDRCKK